MMKQATRFAILILMTLILYGCASMEQPSKESQLIIKAPTIAENGEVVPVLINLSSPLSNTQSLEIYANGELGSTVTVAGDCRITSFSGRFRMMTSGKIKAVLREKGTIIGTAERPVTIGHYVARGGKSAKHDTSFKKRVKGKKVMMLFANQMYQNDYLEFVTLVTEQGKVTFHNTPVMSTYPYLSVSLTREPGFVDIVAAMNHE